MIVVAALEYVRVPALAKVGHRVVGVEVIALGTQSVNQVERQGLLADLHGSQRRRHPTHNLVADDQLGQRATQPRLQVAQVVNQVRAAQRFDHQCQRRLGRRLLIYELGLAAAADAKHRQPVMLGQRMGHASGVGRAVGADHGAHIQAFTTPTGDDVGSPLPL